MKTDKYYLYLSEEEYRRVSGEELTCLIDGARLDKKLKRTEVFERKTS